MSPDMRACTDTQEWLTANPAASVVIGGYTCARQTVFSRDCHCALPGCDPVLAPRYNDVLQTNVVRYRPVADHLCWLQRRRGTVPQSMRAADSSRPGGRLRGTADTHIRSRRWSPGLVPRRCCAAADGHPAGAPGPSSRPGLSALSEAVYLPTLLTAPQRGSNVLLDLVMVLRFTTTVATSRATAPVRQRTFADDVSENPELVKAGSSCRSSDLAAC